MAERTCGWCNSSLDGMQSNARYCCLQHKKNAASKRHRERNPSYYKRYHGSPARTAWLEANRDRVRACAREYAVGYRERNPQHAKDWWAANPERHRLYQAKRRACTQGAFVVTPKDIRRLIARNHGECAYCGATPALLHIDHVVPLKRGGRHSIGNLVPACQSCNSSKNARLLYPWRVTVLLTSYAHTLQ